MNARGFFSSHAIRELGVDRLVWGGRGPSPGFATELGKVLDAGE
jgi:hypothetical protein